MTQNWKTMTVEEWVNLSDEDLLKSITEILAFGRDGGDVKLQELYKDKRFTTKCVQRIVNINEKINNKHNKELFIEELKKRNPDFKQIIITSKDWLERHD